MKKNTTSYNGKKSMITINKNLTRTLLIVAIALLVGRRTILIWKRHQSNKFIVAKRDRASQAAQREHESILLIQTLIESAENKLALLRNHADTQADVQQAHLYMDINDLSAELAEIKEKFNRKNSPGLFLLGPLAAPAQIIKERALKKRLLAIEQKIQRLLNT